VLTGKPLWLEGMFLRSQHLQHYDRWIEHTIESRVAALLPFSWGIRQLRIDPDALRNGQFRVAAIEAILPDGTVIDAPSAQVLPSARHISADAQGKLVYIGLSIRSPGSIDVAEGEGKLYRYRKVSVEVRDSSVANRPAVDIDVGSLNGRIILEGEPLDDLVYLPIAEIEAVDAQGQVRLSESFIPPVLNLGANARLMSIIEQILGLLRSRGNALAQGATGGGGGTRAGMIDLMTLGMVNRYEALLNHAVQSASHTPEHAYRDCIALAGELSAYASDSRRLPELEAYRHTDLRLTFESLLAVLRGMLSIIIERNSVNIPLTERDYGIWVGEIQDRMIFSGRQFVLIARSDVPLETMRTQMPIQIKIGPVEQIRDLVNLQLPGIGISPLSVAPREIPFLQNAVYFALDGGNKLWDRLKDSAAFALHVSGDYPGLDLELWVVQRQSEG